MTVSACSEPYEWDGSLESLMRSQPERFSTVLADPENYRVQILYTQINRDADGNPSFISFPYRLNADEYFYPASTVKLPVGALALEKLRELDVEGLDRDTIMAVGDEEGDKSVGRYVREVLLVSDNHAYNQLYDFVGQQTINERMHAKGHANTRLMHRLSIAMSVDENRRTGPVRFVDGDTVIYEQEEAFSEVDYTAPEPIPLGVAEIIGGERVEGAKDFASKNEYTIQAMHDVIKALMFPDALEPSERFNLHEDDYAFLHANMSTYPTDSGIEEYADAEQYPEGYVKYFMYGGTAPEIPDNIRIYNKVGSAYGFLSDAAYIVDSETGVEFILAATIFTNANGTFNDDTYEYEEIAQPFMRDLGLAIYELETERRAGD